MDKQKQIEEMAKIVAKYYGGFSEYRVAREIYEKVIAKNSENAVVLTEEEYDRLTNSEIGELVKENEELGKSNVEWSELYRKLKIKYQQARKKTAEKFAEKSKQRLSDKLHRGKALHTTVFGKEYVRRIFKEAIDETCKEITEGE